MPFKSKAQAKYMFAKKPQLAKEFASKTPDFKDLPNHVNPKHVKRMTDNMAKGMKANMTSRPKRYG